MHESFSQYSPPQRLRYRTMSVAGALLAMSIGGAAFLGWVFDVDFLKRIHPNLVTMKANTAVCLVLISSSLLLLHDPGVALWKRRLGQVVAALVATVGLLTLSEHVIGWNLGIDQLLFYES